MRQNNNLRWHLMYCCAAHTFSSNNWLFIELQWRRLCLPLAAAVAVKWRRCWRCRLNALCCCGHGCVRHCCFDGGYSFNMYQSLFPLSFRLAKRKLMTFVFFLVLFCCCFFLHSWWHFFTVDLDKKTERFTKYLLWVIHYQIQSNWKPRSFYK